MNAEKKPGLIERGANFFEKLHYGIGAVALAGAAVFHKEILAAVGVIEVAHGLIINGLKRLFKNRSGHKAAPKLAAAH